MAVRPNNPLISFSPSKQMTSLLPFPLSVPLALPLSSELLYGFLMKQLQVMATTQFQRLCTSSLSLSFYPSAVSKPAGVAPPELDEERELELLQMDRLLKWMALVFEVPDPVGVPEETRRVYKKELFSIYRTLCSDYQQYRNWKTYNQGLWLLSSYRCRDTKGLARKLLSDVRLFKEGLQLLFLMEHKSPAAV